jgi:RND superfamily putative drug exporter
LSEDREVRRLGLLVTRRPWWVLGLALALLPVSGVVGGSVERHLSGGGLDDPSSESSRAARLLRDDFHTGEPNLLLVVTARAGSVDASAVVNAGTALTRDLAARRGVAEAVSYWSLGSPPDLRSRDGSQALVVARIAGGADVVDTAVATLATRYRGSGPVVSVGVAGEAEVDHQLRLRAKRDLWRAEAFSFPLILAVLALLLGGVVAAGLPLLVGLLAVVGTLLVLQLLTLVTQVPILALDVTTAMGLALAVAYSLLIVSRYREELHAGRDPDTAMVRTLLTAGRTVIFSAIAVAVSLAALLVFPLDLLRSFAEAGIGVVALAAAGAVLVLPALLHVLGPRIHPRAEPSPRTAGGHVSGFWYRRAWAVMRRPIPIAIGVTGLLLVVGVPVLGLELGLSDARVLPAGTPVRDVADSIRDHFSGNHGSALSVVVPDSGDAASRGADVDGYAARLSRLTGVSRVDALTGSYAGGRRVFAASARSQRFATPTATWLAVIPSIEALSPGGETLTANVRATSTPFTVLVDGPSARLVDTKAAIFDRLPAALGLIGTATFVLLILMLGGLLLPLEALGLNVLSLSATFGALVWVFQDGHLSGLLGFTPTGSISVAIPVLMLCVAFGLSMGFEVLLLSRIKEEHDLRGVNDEAVAAGLERTGRIITAAALLFALVSVAFVTSGITPVKMLCLGSALAVLVDAFCVRLALVPALMHLSGRANWWGPRWIRRLHVRVGIWGSEPSPVLDLPGAVRKARVSLNGNSPKAPTLVGGPILRPPDEPE